MTDTLDLAEIKARRKAWEPGTCGVYFLFDENDNLIYIGQSVCVEQRLITHRNAGKKFKSVTILECDRKHLEGIEATYILRFKPLLNWRGTNLIYNGTKLFELIEERRVDASPR